MTKKKVCADYFDECGPTYFLRDIDGTNPELENEFTEEEIAAYEKACADYDSWQEKLSKLRNKKSI